MSTHLHQTQKDKEAVQESPSPQREPTVQFVDNRPQHQVYQSLKTAAQNSPQTQQTIQLREMMDQHSESKNTVVPTQPNKTGLPDQLKTGVENLSGYSMDDVKVHRNSPKPAQLQAHAYAQGTDIHLAPGQEKHLPHEAWHVVQQKQGRVKPTMQMKGKVNVNDDAGMEREADVMGRKAVQMKVEDSKQGFRTSKRQKQFTSKGKSSNHSEALDTGTYSPVIQRIRKGLFTGWGIWGVNKEKDALWTELEQAFNIKMKNNLQALKNLKSNEITIARIKEIEALQEKYPDYIYYDAKEGKQDISAKALNERVKAINIKAENIISEAEEREQQEEAAAAKTKQEAEERKRQEEAEAEERNKAEAAAAEKRRQDQAAIAAKKRQQQAVERRKQAEAAAAEKRQEEAERRRLKKEAEEKEKRKAREIRVAYPGEEDSEQIKEVSSLSYFEASELLYEMGDAESVNWSLKTPEVDNPEREADFFGRVQVRKTEMTTDNTPITDRYFDIKGKIKVIERYIKDYRNLDDRDVKNTINEIVDIDEVSGGVKIQKQTIDKLKQKLESLQSLDELKFAYDSAEYTLDELLAHFQQNFPNEPHTIAYALEHTKKKGGEMSDFGDYVEVKEGVDIETDITWKRLAYGWGKAGSEQRGQNAPAKAGTYEPLLMHRTQKAGNRSIWYLWLSDGKMEIHAFAQHYGKGNKNYRKVSGVNEIPNTWKLK
jgi:hypothetical protein